MVAQMVQLIVGYVLLNSAVDKLADRKGAWSRLRALAPELRDPKGVALLACLAGC